MPLSGMTILRPFLFAALLALPGVPAIAADDPATVAQFRERAWTTLEKAPSFRPKTEYLFGTLGMDQASRFDYWLIRLSEKEPDAPQWADSRTCPALRAAVAGMASLEPISPDPPISGKDDLHIVVDGTRYTLQGTGRYSSGASGRFSMSGNVDSPLAAWTQQLERDLASCWKSGLPE